MIGEAAAAAAAPTRGGETNPVPKPLDAKASIEICHAHRLSARSLLRGKRGVERTPEAAGKEESVGTTLGPRPDPRLTPCTQPTTHSQPLPTAAKQGSVGSYGNTGVPKWDIESLGVMRWGVEGSGTSSGAVVAAVTVAAVATQKRVIAGERFLHHWASD